MSDEKQFGGAVQPNLRDEALRSTRNIYRLGAAHVVALLRGTDLEGIPDEHIDRIADFVEAQLKHNLGPTPWELPDWWYGG